MPVYLSTATIGNDQTLLTLGHSAELMAWFYPQKDHSQHIHTCLIGVYHGAPWHGHLHWTYGDIWEREQRYEGDTNIVVTQLTSQTLGLQLVVTDVVPPEHAVLQRRIEARNIGTSLVEAGIFIYGDWNIGAIRTGNSVRYDGAEHALVQGHHDATVAIGGDALESWQCGKAGEGWGSNALYDLDDGALNHQNLEIGDVNWSFGFNVALSAGESVTRTAVFAMAHAEADAIAQLKTGVEAGFEAALEARTKADAEWLKPGLAALEATGGADIIPEALRGAYRRSLLCLPLLCGEEGVAVAAPEFDPEFISCGGYGYHWPRDGGEYVSGLFDAGYPGFAEKFFAWCARYQDPSGLWHQRYFLNGQPGPNWCLPPEMLQVDQVGAVLWALGKVWRANPKTDWDNSVATQKMREAAAADAMQALSQGGNTISSDRIHDIEQKFLEKLRGSGGGGADAIKNMTRLAADYLASRLTEKGVHANAFDTWETFVGSFTYSNAAIYAALRTAGDFLGEAKYHEAADRLKAGVLEHFVKEDGYPYLVRGFDSHGHDDLTVDSASLGAIEPFGLLDLTDSRELAIAEGTLRSITEKLDVDWEDGRAIRRFEGDAYVGGVPACVNTLWMARCCLHVADQLEANGRNADALALTDRAGTYLQTVLRRATPTGLLPELMQGPTGQRWWAAPHGWAMASFVSGTLRLAARMALKK